MREFPMNIGITAVDPQTAIVLKSLEKEEICTYTFFYDYVINFTLCFFLWIYMYQPEGLSLVFTAKQICQQRTLDFFIFERLAAYKTLGW